jgi:phosphoglycerate dehydrogenase-like enzyme
MARDPVNVLMILPPSENAGDPYGRGLQSRFPELAINWVHHHDQVSPYVADAQVILTFSPFMARHVAEEAGRLEWIQILGSGLDGITDLPFRGDVVITNGHGVQAIPVSEAALGLIFALCRGYRRLARNQAARVWERWPSQILHDKTVGILGVGAIAEALAPKCKAMGMRVIGVSSAPRAIDGFDRVFHKNELLVAAGEVDFLVLLTPHTPATHHMVDAAVFAAMKPTAYLVNVARGGIVDEAALVEALRACVIRGAALDVFEAQPLPPESPLWAMDNVVISPHMAGLNEDYPAHIMPLLEANFRAFLAGDHDAMINVYRRV